MIKTIDALVEALEELLFDYVSIAVSGDCGNWDAEDQPAVVKARAALAQARAEQAEPYAYIYEFDHAMYGVHRSFSPSQWNGLKPTRTVPVFTTPPAAPANEIKLTADKAAAVDTAYKWRPIDNDTPRGVKLQLINRVDGVAYFAQYYPHMRVTHWAPLPTF